MEFCLAHYLHCNVCGRPCAVVVGIDSGEPAIAGLQVGEIYRSAIHDSLCVGRGYANVAARPVPPFTAAKARPRIAAVPDDGAD